MSHSQFHSTHDQPSSLKRFRRCGRSWVSEVQSLNHRTCTLHGPVFHQLLNMDNVKLLFLRNSMAFDYETILFDFFYEMFEFQRLTQTSLRLSQFGLLCFFCWIEKSRVEIMKCNIWIGDIYCSSCLSSKRIHSLLLSGDYFRAINSYCHRSKWSNFGEILAGNYKNH